MLNYSFEIVKIAHSRQGADNENKLTELLEGKEKSLLLDLINAQSEVNGTTAVEGFINGFRLGARIVLEIMSDEDGCLRDIT